MAASARIWALCAVVGSAFALAGPAAAACGLSGYSYAGVEASRPASGVSARLTALAAPVVQSGHVAAWVGVGGAGAAPDGSDEWLQAGLSASPFGASELYYEVAQPGSDPQYVTIAADVPAGATHAVSVLEVKGHPGTWRVWVDGSPVTGPIALPGSHGAWNPIATAESWDGGTPSCNGFSYRFDDVRLAAQPGGSWQALRSGTWLQDPGYRVTRQTPASFLAALA